MTPHINSKKEDIAKIVIMPGDPLRAKFMAETFLEDYKLVNEVRNVFAYTGKYKQKEITIFASGMGTASMGIYSYELYKFYDVETIIRVGSCGSFKEEINLFDLILVDNSVSESSFGKVLNNYQDNIVASSNSTNEMIIQSSRELNKKLYKGNIYCSEVFYSTNESPLIKQYNCLGVEMETFALFLNAQALNKKAACLLTVSDSLVTKQETTPEQRETGFIEMMEVVLNAALGEV